MQKLIIDGGLPLNGETEIQTAKNAALPIIAACILTDEPVTIENCPHLNDIDAMLNIMRHLGCTAEFFGDNLTVCCRDVALNVINSDLTGKLRSSIFILGSILSRCRRAYISHPGGCEIGLRPIDLHISGLKGLSVKIVDDCGVICCDGTDMKSGVINLDFASVGATENLMMAGALLDGETVIVNAAREPEIVDLAEFINAMGGDVRGAGGSVISIRGVKKLHGCAYTPMPDRICAGTVLAAVNATGGSVTVKNVVPDHIFGITERLKKAGARLSVRGNAVRITADARPRPIHKLETNVYPAFPTDMQPQFCAMLARASGSSVIVENLFENRFGYTSELVKMGASITVKDRIAVVNGVSSLHGATLKACDLRGGAALVIAALAAEGRSVVYGVEHIDRGYECIERTFAELGGAIHRAEV
ncbi:UDP-N-acetylglucosamine 1-carboxyvinyltransferase [Anaerocaecibacter muris]|uniref:UDP-N-acetylglucosamine 1-carboxyvinyltransferase n=1 Tax=Anaerocaecibacter muris TaxID=2941513 RepID=UPI0020412FA6|nr:UDP-N-acetylglucosamine 1-carboxyvinyltransferase [Anaerocaecibacter muris]